MQPRCVQPHNPRRLKNAIQKGINYLPFLYSSNSLKNGKISSDPDQMIPIEDMTDVTLAIEEVIKL